jgi:excisionase family DNA binding protein
MTLEDWMIDKYGPFMDTEELAGLLRIKKTTVYNQIYEGRLALPHVKRGKKYLFPTVEVAKHLEGVGTLQ